MSLQFTVYSILNNSFKKYQTECRL